MSKTSGAGVFHKSIICGTDSAKSELFVTCYSSQQFGLLKITICIAMKRETSPKKFTLQ